MTKLTDWQIMKLAKLEEAKQAYVDFFNELGGSNLMELANDAVQRGLDLAIRHVRDTAELQ